MKKIIPLLAVIILVAACKKSSVPVSDNTTSPVTNIDDAVTFTSVQIGTKKFMIKNLTVTHYRNGDLIPEVKGHVAWSKLTTGAWCWQKNDSATGAVYGRLYNWYAVHDPRGLAPTGWHIPTDAEWDTLTNRLGGERLAGGKMKSTGTIEAGTGLWYFPNTGATNSSGFTGLPGGARIFYNGTFFNIGKDGYWWSSNEVDSNYARSRFLSYNNSYVNRNNNGKSAGLYVRCVKD